MRQPTTIWRLAGLPLLVAVAATVTVSTTGGCAHIDDDDEEVTTINYDGATTTPRYHGDGSIPERRPVVRMSDGERDWEIEIPETERGYQVTIPTRQDRQVQPDRHALTRADRELIDHLRQTDPDFEREGVYDGDGQHAVDQQARRDAGDPEADAPDDVDTDEADPAPTRPSYLRGIDDVQQLFEAGHYEQAMIHLADLEEAYPNDERIQSMKGTLWLELGREDLARDAWERVLQINPDNESVQQALQRLEGDVDEQPLDEDEQLEEFEQQAE